MNRHRLTAFGAALAAYAVLLLVSRELAARTDATSPAAALSALLPLPAGAVLLAIAWSEFESLDELERRIRLMALAVAFGGTLLTMLSWGFLEGVGLDRPSGFLVFGILVAFYLGGLIWARARYR
ncbi:MAG: hypothetical protein QOF49_1417 [Chloroflexota bacterium]|jgi:ammonia channel protein AmtB|nr:hypothetical protein [Chloroflexota bacterium]